MSALFAVTEILADKSVHTVGVVHIYVCLIGRYHGTESQAGARE